MQEKKILEPSKDNFYDYLKIVYDNLKCEGNSIIKNEIELLKKFDAPFKNYNNEDVRNLVGEINNKYSTLLSGPAMDTIAVSIKTNKEIDDKVLQGEYEPIELIRTASDKDNYSFATKYCHHCNPNKYPIYDAVNVRVLTVFLAYKDLKNDKGKRDYKKYCECYDVFCSELEVVETYDKFCKELGSDINSIFSENNKGFFIDKYIQFIGGQRTNFFEMMKNHT